MFLGYGAGDSNTSGFGNIAIGPDAGISIVTGQNNIYIGSVGCLGLCDESNTIRIGGDPYDNWGPQTAVYVTGIYGATVDGNGVPVYVDDNGKLGIAVSSRRFKEQIVDMGDSTSALMTLRPVTFVYKPEYAKGDRTLQYGLIAEEVESFPIQDEPGGGVGFQYKMSLEQMAC